MSTPASSSSKIPQTPPRSSHPTSSVPDTPYPAGMLPSKPGALPNGFRSSQGSEFGYTTVEAQRPALEGELANCTFDDSSLSERSFQGIIANGKIQKFLQKCALYDNKSLRWRNVPADPEKEPDLYKPLNAIFNAVIKHFGLSGGSTAKITHNVRFPHIEGLGEKYPDPENAPASSESSSPQIPALRSSPDLTIYAVVKNKKAVNNFPYPTDKSKLGFESVLTPVEVKKHGNFGAAMNKIQVAVYARQIFRHQGNRHFVNSLVVSERSAMLYVFARDGVHYSSAIDIHKDAATFVKFILGASSMEAKYAGFDRSIFYEDGQRYIRMLGQKSNQTTNYRMHKPTPIFDQRTIRGRGTCCWMVKEKGEYFIIKDSWRYYKRNGEWELMEEVNGLEGVGQMLDFEDDVACLSTLRNLDNDNLPDGLPFRDRILSRLRLVCYGGTIESFDSPLQLLYAYRDAICGHRNLWERGDILHRDISTNNILLGTSTTAGNRGILIDLDLAIRITRDTSLYGQDFATGTRAFQSMNVLDKYNPLASPKPHDHMDDLESFFYVLCWICCGYSGPGKKVEHFPSGLLVWEHGDPYQAKMGKDGVYTNSFDARFKPTPYFGEIFEDLLYELRDFFQAAMNVSRPRKPKGPHPSLVELRKTSDKAYDTVLGYVDTAIKRVQEKEQQEKEQQQQQDRTGPSKTEELATPKALSFVDGKARATRRTGKRGSDEVGQDANETPTKNKRARRTAKPNHAPHTSSSLSSAISNPDEE